MMHNMRGWMSALACTALVACRLGGPSGADAEGTDDASIGIDSGSESGVFDSSSGGSHPDTSTPTGDDSGGGGTDATVSSDGGDAGTNPSDAHVDGSHIVTDSGGDGFDACVPTTPPLVCDPVCNTGCSGLNRCDVSDTPNTGSCIGIWIQAEGSACLPKTATTDPCGASLTCVNGVCVRVCYHNADCPTAGATCCKDSVPTSNGPSGFKSCGACTP